MKTYAITSHRRKRIQRHIADKGGAETIEHDYSAWAADNGSVTSVTVTVESGDAGVSGENLASNVHSMVVTTSTEGRSLIKLSATDGTNIDVQYLEITAKDPTTQLGSDYRVWT